MTDNRSLIAAIIVIILILGIIGGSIYYLFGTFRGRTTPTPSPTPLATAPLGPTQVPFATFSPQNTNPQATISPNSTPAGAVLGAGTYSGVGFQLTYPRNWGLLSCTDSQNFELDPYSSTPQKIDCNFALKPTTVLVDQGVNCTGDKLTIGPHQVIKSKRTNVSIDGKVYDVIYRWCFSAAGKSFDFTHRVSSKGNPASSKDDFSAQVEQAISSIKSQ